MKIISAPFGNYLRFKGWVSTIGTFTPKCRGGFWFRVWRCLRTLRWDRHRRGWVNRLGLPNPGIDWLAANPEKAKDRIVSIGLAHDDGIRDVLHLLAVCRKLVGVLYYELNVSCPNEERGVAPDVFIEMCADCLDPEKIIVKLPPDTAAVKELVEYSVAKGIRRFHCCNTIPTERGGLSGHSLTPFVCSIIVSIKKEWPHVDVIAGGGVNEQAMAYLYRVMGADHFAVGSAWLNPLSWGRLRRMSE